MCCRIRHAGRTYKPGDIITVKSADRQEGAGKWAGFARSETAQATWVRFDVELDVPAEEFAENNRNTGGRTFGRVVEGHMIRAIGDRNTGHVKILTRDATETEKAFFGHSRVPVAGPARF